MKPNDARRGTVLGQSCYGISTVKSVLLLNNDEDTLKCMYRILVFLSAPMTFSKTSIILEIGETCRQKHANHFQFDEVDRL